MIAAEHRLALPAGYQLGKYRLQGVLGAGGFGITYLAEDGSLGRRVAIKELLPNDIATRLDGTTVVAKTKSEEDNLAWARERFVDEGRALAACDHPNVVNVYEMIEANGTAYMVTKYEEGRSLERWLRELGRTPTESELRGMLFPLLSGLEKVHTAGFLHRDIKPENIYLTDDGRPVLLDFGSARQAVSNRSMMMTTIVTAGYAPFEQYHEDGHQGPWSDFYALAAVMHRAIAGKKPPEAVRRVKDDPMTKLAKDFAASYSARFLTAIDKALAVDAAKRPQSVNEWRELLGGEAPGRTAPVPPAWWQRAVELVQQYPARSLAGAGAVILFSALVWNLKPPTPRTPVATSTPVPTTPAPAPVAKTSTPAPAPPRAATPAPAPVVAPSRAVAGPRAGERWQNSLGMNFAPLPGTALHLSVWSTRRQDFEAFVKAAGYSASGPLLTFTSGNWKLGSATWSKPGFTQKPDHPVVGVSAYDAAAFCHWLTEAERATGVIDRTLAYRLPTDEEWTAAAGTTAYSWGDTWPPPPQAGNFGGEEAKTTLGSRNVLAGYRDSFIYTAPVTAFRANAHGFTGLGGNVLEWCETWYRKEMNTPELHQRDPTLNHDGGGTALLVLRGSSCFASTQESLFLSHRAADLPTVRAAYAGFRCILGPQREALLPPTPPVITQIDPREDDPAPREPGAVDPKLVGVWETSGIGAKGPWTQRWEARADGRYTASGVITDKGQLTASEGHMRQRSDFTGQWIEATYELRGPSLATDGPLGAAVWKKIGSGTSTSREKSGDTSSPSRSTKSSDPSRRPTDVERKVRDLIRRKLPF